MDRDKRMKAYEQPWQLLIPAKSYTIIRVDGRAFHTLTKGLEKPFDHDFMEHMDAVGMHLCAEIQGAQFAYIQSDEVSVLITDFTSNAAQWFGGDVLKMVSISAAEATVAFNAGGKHGTFDSRVFTVPDRHEAINYFLWRQADSMRNAIQMVGQAHFTPKELHKVNLVGIAMKLAEKRVLMDSYPTGARLGRVVTKQTRNEFVTYTRKDTGDEHTTEALRTFWQARTAPWFDWDERGFLETNVPYREEINGTQTAEPVLDSGPPGSGGLPAAGQA